MISRNTQAPRTTIRVDPGENGLTWVNARDMFNGDYPETFTASDGAQWELAGDEHGNWIYVAAS